MLARKRAFRQAKAIAKRKDKRRAVLTLCKHLKEMLKENPQVDCSPALGVRSKHDGVSINDY